LGENWENPQTFQTAASNAAGVKPLYLQRLGLSQVVCNGGDGGNRTRVQKHSTDSSTYLVQPIDLTSMTRTHTLHQGESPIFNIAPSNPT
jgi:hypothetical protein